MMAASTMPRVGVEELEGEKLVRFEGSPPMPPHLLAFAVGRFQVVEGPEEPVRLRALLPRGARGRGVKARLGAVAELYRILEAYLGPPFEVEKLDLVAVPGVEYGAVASPGLFAFHQELLAGAYAANFEATAAHELIHLWFGNLVTFAWWNDRWLSDAFAWWLAEDVARARSEGKPLSEVSISPRDGGALEAARVSASSNAEIRRLFDPEADQSGWDDALEAGVLALRWVAWKLGPGETRKLLRRYLQEYRYRAVSLEELELMVGEE